MLLFLPLLAKASVRCGGGRLGEQRVSCDTFVVRSSTHRGRPISDDVLLVSHLEESVKTEATLACIHIIAYKLLVIH